MDDDLDSILSPSKARRDAAQAKSWAYVASWLSNKYHPHSVPRFERNDDTLQALLQLVAINTAADEQARLLRRAQEHDYEVLLSRSQSNAQAPSPVDEIAGTIVDALDARSREALNDVAEAKTVLGSFSSDPEDLAMEAMSLMSHKFDLEEQIRSVETLRQQLDVELFKLREYHEQIRRIQAEDDDEVLQQQMAEWNRTSKMLGVKFSEYRTQIAALDNLNVTGPSLEDIRQKEQIVSRQRDLVRMLQRDLQDYQGLPPVVEEAREEYRRLAEQVSQLQDRRNELFEDMANG